MILGKRKSNSGQFKKGQESFMKGRKHSEETKKKLSEAHGGKNHWNYGKHLSEETKSKIGNANKGTIHTGKSRENFSKGQKKRFEGKHGTRYGKKVTEASRQKMSRSRKKLYADGYQVWNKETHDVEYIEKMRKKRLKQVFPAKDTKIEKILQNELQKNGIEFEKYKPILGQPDIFIEPNICIFADGDYWHGWLYLNGKRYDNAKKLNNEFFEKVIKRDNENTKNLKKQGYKIERFWEHEINKDPEKCLQKIIKIINESTTAS